MAALQCEICGGKLIGKAGGIFECDSCGMQYDKTWVKEKVQEIKGTVKVEGTVEVQGTVKVEGPVKVEGGVNKEALLKRGQMALEDENWEEATEFFDQVLNRDAECAEAYLGKCCAELGVHNSSEIQTLDETDYISSSDYRRALQFASSELKSLLAGYEKTVRENEEKAELAWEEEMQAVCTKRQAEEEEKQARINHLALLRKRTNDVGKRMYFYGNRFFAVDVSGTVWCVDWSSEKNGVSYSKTDKLGQIEYLIGDGGTVVGHKVNGTIALIRKVDPSLEWDSKTKYKEVAVRSGVLIGLKEDGSATLLSKCGSTSYDVTGWQNIKTLGESHCGIVGIRNDGTIVTAKMDNSFVQWEDITSVSSSLFHTVGLKSDGTVVFAEHERNPYYYKISQWRKETHKWFEISAIAVDNDILVALRKDGTVYAMGDNNTGRCDVQDWSDIVGLSVSSKVTVGLRADGTVLVAGKGDYRGTASWTGIVAVATYFDQIVGLKENGTLVTTANVPDVKDWKLFESTDTLENEMKAAKIRIKKEYGDRVKALDSEEAALREELGQLKGLFTGKRRREIEERLVAVYAERKNLERNM